MKKFAITMTRNVTQSTLIEVEAENADDAARKAYEVVDSLGSRNWETHSDGDDPVIPNDDCIEEIS